MNNRPGENVLKKHGQDDTEELKMRGQVVVGLCSLYTKHVGQELLHKATEIKAKAADNVKNIFTFDDNKRPRSYSMGDIPDDKKKW
mmetsp:Transcript_3112/g.4801  ORF Transcript_3112/g.4801 Transcript_3112/m.4801 type:complete len:86 (-) Transcript_3112:188-445(-)|eukprot:CAMPEP_0185018046 /NCGR_PEP_ID=MMETSP1103-20130426/894_1 /TAXON_ID=36769 /ORGANISM="Paraphysomonas bandaiensis, Strain Caron Lab Isolate" /LENGTH=85 /DNA_ID=CAMNT_0027547723 /DNA_START=109 /DNA_END=366 /DNA_ORIENTATION=+